MLIIFPQNQLSYERCYVFSPQYVLNLDELIQVYKPYELT